MFCFPDLMATWIILLWSKGPYVYRFEVNSKPKHPAHGCERDRPRPHLSAQRERFFPGLKMTGERTFALTIVIQEGS
jgi:hypothetical protein